MKLKMKLKVPPYDNLLHLLYECPRTQTFWQMVIAWWNEKRSETVALNATDILYGYKPESNLFQALCNSNPVYVTAPAPLFIIYLLRFLPVK